MLLKRTDGEEHPHIPLGMFRFRLPFIHYRFTIVEAFIGLVCSFIYFIPVTLYTDLFGLSVEQAYALIHFSLFLGLLHGHFGDYAIGSGWITASLPLVMAAIGALPEGVERVYALIAIQLWLALIMLVFGVTGLAKKVMEFMPQTLKAGILIGAGVAAFWTLWSPLSEARQSINNFPWGIGVAGLVTIVLIWSYPLLAQKKKSPFLANLITFGLPIGFILGGILGTIAGEIGSPDIRWTIVAGDWSFIWDFSILGVGLPPASIFFDMLPLSLLIYVIVYGDFVFIETIVKAAATRRPDEKIPIDGSRAHTIVGVRNLLHALFGPHPILAGASYTAYSAVITDRWGRGRDQMESLYDGMNTSNWFLIIGSFTGPIVYGATPMLGIALGIGLSLQGFVCAYVGLKMVKYVQQSGVALVMGMVIATRGAAWGLAVGIILYLLMEFRFNKKDRLDEVEPELLMEPKEEKSLAKAQEEVAS